MEFSNFFGGGNETNLIKEYLNRGALILDVRTPEEWAEGKVADSKLITLNEIPQRIDEIKAWNKPIIIVCRSGGRAENVLNYFKTLDIDAINGGAWQNADI